MIQYYERGNRDGKDVEIPRTVRLACYAIACGVEEFDGRTVQWAMHSEDDAYPATVDDDEDDED